MLFTSSRHGALAALDAPGAKSHVCHFYRTGQDLAETLVPWFRAGLEGGQDCVWVTSDPLGIEKARCLLSAEVTDLAKLEATHQIEFVDHRTLYGSSRHPRPQATLDVWIARAAAARAKGRRGLRVTGNTSSLGPETCEGFSEHETRVTRTFEEHGIQAICSYKLDRCGDEEIAAVVQTHEATLVRRATGWDLVAPPISADDVSGDEIDAAEVARSVALRMSDVFGGAGILLRARTDQAARGRWQRRAIERILLELLSNAAQHGGGHLVELDVIPAGARVILAIKDRGPGLDDDAQRQLLDGLGPARIADELRFGLWITRRIVEALGGSLRIASAARGGSTFFVILPR